MKPSRLTVWLLAGLVWLLASCGDDRADALEECPDADRSLCEFAATVEIAFHEGDWDRLADLWLESEVECSFNPEIRRREPEFDPGECMGIEYPGTARGFKYGRSPFRVISREWLVEELALRHAALDAGAEDDAGDGQVRVFTIARGFASLFTDCQDCATLVLSGVYRYDLPFSPEPTSRRLLITHVEKVAGDWRVRWIQTEFLTDTVRLLRGGRAYTIDWHPWNPREGAESSVSGGFFFGGLAEPKDPDSCLALREEPGASSAETACIQPRDLLVLFAAERKDGERWWFTGEVENGWAPESALEPVEQVPLTEQTPAATPSP